MRRKVLLALAFAGGLQNTHLPSFCDNVSESSDLVVNQIANCAQATPEIRANWLLRLASSYLAGEDRISLDGQYRAMANAPEASFFRRNSTMEKDYVRWANTASLAEHVANHGPVATKGANSSSPPISKENLFLAGTAVQKALTQLDQTTDKFAKLNMYFIASRLFQKMGNAKNFQKCNTVLANAFESCEGKSQIDEILIKASSSVLNSMAYGLIPIEIPDARPPLETPVHVASFAEKDLLESEKLKLRAVAMTDRLSASNDVRRRAHRDLSLWYSRIGKIEVAEREKQILFELVGCKKDSILYPQSGMCGHLVWWNPEPVSFAGDCGMG
jgi:hypothetical protein